MGKDFRMWDIWSQWNKHSSYVRKANWLPNGWQYGRSRILLQKLYTPHIGLAAALLDKSRYKNLKAVAYPDRYSVYLRRRQHFPELSGYSAHYGGECYSHPFSGGNFPIALTANFHVHRNFLRWLTKLNQKGYRYLWQPFFIYLLILQQHCNKSLSKTSESGLFTAFLQKSYQVFFLYNLKKGMKIWIHNHWHPYSFVIESKIRNSKGNHHVR